MTNLYLGGLPSSSQELMSSSGNFLHGIRVHESGLSIAVYCQAVLEPTRYTSSCARVRASRPELNAGSCDCRTCALLICTHLFPSLIYIILIYFHVFSSIFHGAYINSHYYQQCPRVSFIHAFTNCSCY